MAIKRSIRAALTGAIGLSSMLGLGVIAAPSASAATGDCGAAVCMFKDSQSRSAVLKGAWQVCGYYSNLKDEGFNDVISSIYNHANHYQDFWSNAKKDGDHLTVFPGKYLQDLAGTGMNDSISSVVWIG
jgi:hypothetical protein